MPGAVMRVVSRGVLVGLGIAAGAAAGALAQVRGLPVRNAGIGTGVGLAADIGFPNAAGGKGYALGLTGTVGLGPFGATATVSRFDPKAGDAVNGVGATANLKIFGGPLVPFSITMQGGLGYDKSTFGTVTTKTVHVPAGIGLALTIPNPAFSIKPWAAPRLDLRRVDVSGGGGSDTDVDFAIGGGVDIGFLNGLSLRAMYDRVQVSGGPTSVISFGLGFRL